MRNKLLINKLRREALFLLLTTSGCFCDFWAFKGKVVSNNNVIKIYKKLLINEIQRMALFSLLTTSGCFCNFLAICGGGGK